VSGITVSGTNDFGQPNGAAVTCGVAVRKTSPVLWVPWVKLIANERTLGVCAGVDERASEGCDEIWFGSP
jgi:hypothetical protein